MTSPSQTPEERANRAVEKRLRTYFSSYSFWFIGAGLGSVLIPYIVTFTLHESPEKVGIAQTVSLIPMLVLILFGGAVADRSEPRQFLTRLQLLATLPPLSLAGLILLGNLSYTAVLVYGLVQGSFAAFVMPTRDALLTAVAGRNLPKAVAAATSMQFLSQVFGFALAGTAAFTGEAILLIAQATLYALAGFLTMQLPPVPARSFDSHNGSRLADIRDGLKEAIQEPNIIWPIVLMLMGGICLIGTYLVGLPIMVRDIYNGTSIDLALVNATFMIGTAVSAALMAKYARFHRPGRAMILSNCTGITIVTLLSFNVPQWGFYLLLFIWGLGGGIGMSTSRAMVQEAAPESHRARILSVYQLGFMGGAPIGSFSMGFLINELGPIDALKYPPMMMVLVLLCVILFTPLWRLKGKGPTV